MAFDIYLSPREGYIPYDLLLEFDGKCSCCGRRQLKDVTNPKYGNYTAVCVICYEQSVKFMIDREALIDLMALYWSHFSISQIKTWLDTYEETHGFR